MTFVIAGETCTSLESPMDAVMDKEKENDNQQEAGDDEGLGALTTADYQLRQPRLPDERIERVDSPSMANELGEEHDDEVDKM